MTEAQALALEQEFGGTFIGDRLRFLDVTTYGDGGRQYLLETPRCDHCGSVEPSAHCRRCGASMPGMTYPPWK
jgi:hypothetical protein